MLQAFNLFFMIGFICCAEISYVINNKAIHLLKSGYLD